jgi:hypothetical protein
MGFNARSNEGNLRARRYKNFEPIVPEEEISSAAGDAPRGANEAGEGSLTVSPIGDAVLLRTVIGRIHVVLLQQLVETLSRHARLPGGGSDITSVLLE